VGSHSKVPLAQRLERCHLLDAVRIEVLELQPILKEHHADERPARTETPHLWSDTNEMM
jgi:hypothetical protein